MSMQEYENVLSKMTLEKLEIETLSLLDDELSEDRAEIRERIDMVIKEKEKRLEQKQLQVIKLSKAS